VLQKANPEQAPAAALSRGHMMTFLALAAQPARDAPALGGGAWPDRKRFGRG
jgi:hypothetical protein